VPGDGTARRLVWFPDTSALVTLAVHAPLHRAVVATLSTHHRVLLRAVVAELEDLAGSGDSAAPWAETALGQLDWLGEPVSLDDPVGTRLAAEIQLELAAGRALKHDSEHWGEAAIIALAARAQTVRPLMLSDDYNARVAALARGTNAYSVHKLLHQMIKQQRLAPAVAARFAEALTTAGRAQDYTADELASGKLGRVGQP
jgi:hypothetical protein